MARQALGPKGFLTEEEKQNMPKVTKGLLLRILSYLKPYWVQFLFVFAAILLSATVGLLPSIITGRIVDRALVGEDLGLLIRLLLMAFGALTVSQLIGVLESFINSWISQRIIFDMKNQMYRHLQYIVYDHVAFSYDPSKPLLTDVSFTVPGGKLYAIVGPSGSGKSTVVNMVPRLYDVLGGRVTIAGVDVRDFDLPYLRQCIGVVTQETYLFNGTILENLRYAKEDATMEEIYEACRIANIHDFIMKQPKGYDTEVGNRGLKLSGGEKQRISWPVYSLRIPRS